MTGTVTPQRAAAALCQKHSDSPLPGIVSLFAGDRNARMRKAVVVPASSVPSLAWIWG